MKTARVLIIAGSDSGGGAGIQADIKTVTMLDGHAMTAITAITAQNTLGVQAVHPVPTDMVLAQVESCLSDIGADAIKLGMIGSAETAHALADRLAGVGVPIVFDPVMVATSGSALADAATIAAFDRLMAVATVVTPNRPELAALGGRDAALAHGCALFEKGGHDDGETLTDRLFLSTGETVSWADHRIDTPHTHGTGCTLASAVATGLAQGLPLQQAAERARVFVRLALRDAPGLGQGHGPMGQQRVREDGLVPGLSLNQVTLPATDYAASVAWWRAFGLTQIVDSPGSGYARFEADNGVTLSIHTGEGEPGATVYFEVADVVARCAELERAGLVIDQQPQAESWLWQEARLTDPAGNAVCLYHAGENRRYPAVARFLMPSRKYELTLIAPVAGVDEAGCGPLAGPVVAAAVILPARGVPRGIDDSKKLSAQERRRLHDRLHGCAQVGVGVVEAEEIDTLNIYWARMKAMTLAVDQLAAALNRDPGHVLVDGNRLPRWRYAATPLVGGDALCLSIAAASIIAKHVRDTIMIAHAETYPHYGWHTNMGYAAPVHLKALREHGPTPLHRRSFAPVAQAAHSRGVQPQTLILPI